MSPLTILAVPAEQSRGRHNPRVVKRKMSGFPTKARAAPAARQVICYRDHIRIVAPDVKLAVLEIKWGLVPDMAGIVLMRGLIRDDVARELTWTGRIFNGDEALAMGLATNVSQDPRADALAMARALSGVTAT